MMNEYHEALAQLNSGDKHSRSLALEILQRPGFLGSLNPDQQFFLLKEMLCLYGLMTLEEQAGVRGLKIYLEGMANIPGQIDLTDLGQKYLI
jgi:hypothetical protein